MNKSQTPLVSCIIPVYNRRDLLRTSLSSVVHQTYDNIEILVVDDGSSVPIDDVVDEFDDERIELITHTENRGGGAARNTGIEHSRGKYIAFLDSDDWWLPSKLQKQVEVMEEVDESVGVVGCRGYKTWSGTGIIRDKTPNDHRRGYTSYEPNDAKITLLSGSTIVTTSKVLIKKECLDNVGKFDERLPSMQEHDLNIRLSEEYGFILLRDKLVVKDESVSNRISHDYQAKEEGLNLFVKKHSEKMERELGPESVDNFVQDRLSYIYQLKTVESFSNRNLLSALSALKQWRDTSDGLRPKHLFLIASTLILGNKGNVLANKARYASICMNNLRNDGLNKFVTTQYKNGI